MTTLCSSKAFLARFYNYETKTSFPRNKFNLDRVRYFLSLLGDPQDQFFAFHVAGSKGKGSTCAFCAYVLRELGYRVGLYSSPHLLSLTERVRILNPLTPRSASREMFEGSITPLMFNTLFKEIQVVHDRVKTKRNIRGLTFFEVFTCACFYYFAKQKVDVAVIETGLGGRLDATNTLGKKICGITPIGLEHVDQLGPTIQDIAREKAGVINANAVGVVSAPQISSVSRIFKKQADQFNLKILQLNNDVISCSSQKEVQGQVFDVYTPRHRFEGLHTSLLGEHQAMNAALAISMVERFSKMTPDRSLTKRDVARGVQRTLWPGRFEILRTKPTIILDCAHSEQSIKAFVKAYHQFFSRQKALIVLGVSEDKDRQRVCQPLEAIAEEMILTRSQHPRSHCFSAQEARALIRKKPVTIIEDATQAFEVAIKQAKSQGIVVVIGSVFLVGEIKAYVSR